MTRYYGDAVFEGAEVSDADYARLGEQRMREALEIGDTRAEEASRIVAVEIWARERITEIREMAQAEIDEIIGGRIIEPVYQVKGERTACELCNTKTGEIGTLEMLEARDCVPPFHENCKCWLEEIGYCVL